MFFFVTAFLFAACGNDAPTTKNAVEVGEKEWQKSESGKPSDDLAINAIPDADVLGKVKWALTTLQEEYKKAEGVVPNTGKVTVLIDENLLMIVKNEYGGKVYETRASLKSLDPVAGNMGVILDEVPGDFPGLKVPVLAGQAKVVKMENGSVKSQEDHFEIILSDRQGVERVAGAMLLALQAAHGRL